MRNAISPGLMALLVLSAAMSVGGQVLLKVAMTRTPIPDPPGLLALVWTYARSWQAWTGLALYGTAMLLFLRLLASAPLLQVGLSYSLGYVFLLGMSWMFLDERLDALGLLGALLILVGVILVNR